MKCILCGKETDSIKAHELRNGEKRKVFFCSSCELGILGNPPSAEELKKFYGQEYRKVGKPKINANSDPAELWRIYSKFQGDRLKLITPFLTKKARLLEVGCSAGMFLHHVRDKVKEIVGIDFDKSSAEYAAKKCGCKVYTADIRETPLEKESFDVIAAFQTLEHVSDPRDFIKTLKEYLAPGGVMIIEVPNLYDALAHVYELPNHHRFFYHSSHLWYFTEKSLLKVMSQSGLKAGKVHHIQDYNLLNHLHWVDTDAPEPDCEKGLDLPKVPLRKETPSKMKKEISDFFVSADKEYKELLSRLKITSNILYIGRK